MKKLIMTLLMVTLVATSTFAALNQNQSYELDNYNPFFNTVAPQSFLSLSTFGLYTDAIDLIMNPGKITFVEGGRLYTNLSNLVTNYENQFQSYGYGSYLIGSKFDIAGISPMFLISNRLEQEKYDINETSKEYIDNDLNGYYDQINFYAIDEYEEYIDNEKSIYAGFGKATDNINFGLIYSYNQGNYYFMPDWDWSYANMGNYAYTERDSNLITGDLIYTLDENAVDTLWDNTNNHRIAFGGFNKLGDNLKVGLVAKVGFANLKPVMNAVYKSTEDFSPWTQSFTDAINISDSIYRNLTISGIDYNVNFTAYYWLSENVKTQTDIGYSAFAGNIADNSYGFRYYNWLEEHTMAVGTYHDENDTTETGTITGSMDQKNINFNTKAQIKMNEKLDLGMGFGFSNAIFNQIEHNDYNYIAIDTYDDGDGVQTVSDYVRTATYDVLLSNEILANNYTFDFPVAVVFNITNNLKARLGASYILDIYDYTFTETIDSITPTNVTTVYGDGSTTYQVLNSPYTVDDGYVGNEFGIYSSTRYNYSLSFIANKNLSIDFMGFATDITSWSNWKLQAVINF